MFERLKTFLNRFQRLVLWTVPAVVLPLVFLTDVVRSVADPDIAGGATLREVVLGLAFFCIYLLLDRVQDRRVRNLPKEIGRLLMYTAGVLALLGFLSLTVGFDTPSQAARSLRHTSLLLLSSIVAGTALMVVSLVTLIRMREMILYKKTRSVRRNFLLYLIGLFVNVAANLPFIPLEASIIGSLAFVATVVVALVNSFKQSWIVFLTRREKVYTIVYAGVLFLALTTLDVFLARSASGRATMLGFSNSLHAFVQMNALLATFYFGMTFVSTLFHLPTAEMFERKQSELNSLQNLGRLVTQVLDFSDLVRTVTQMTTEVCGARAAWLELIDRDEATGAVTVRTAARQQITQETIDALTGEDSSSLRRTLLDLTRALMIDDLWTDRRTRQLKADGVPRGSLLSVPLLSHGHLVGVLHAIKDAEQGFDQDDIDVMTAFADHATIAIENARLIARSIERERLKQEMMLAQRMQKRLLPQKMPTLRHVDCAAVSESSAEVGGDYYDFFPLDENHIGLIVADVAGKGVSAAFYMAEMKGIFLSLSRIYRSPRELLVQANRSLLESLEKNAFISVVYAVIDTAREELVLARAGHCPVIYVSGERAELVRPSGIGLGLTEGPLFTQATEERVLRMSPDDICVFYTDGITEARNASDEEFGYERLLEAVRLHRAATAEEIKDGILRAVRTFLGNSAYTDDMTLVVIKWRAE